MNEACAVVLLGLASSMFGTASTVQSLPKSGTISLNSGWKANSDTAQVVEGRIFGWGSFCGVQRGSGPLHMGSAVCSYTLRLTSGAGPGSGACAWTDADGDKIFTDYSGTLAANGFFNGMNQFTAGTREFSGITGKGPFQCKALSGQGHFGCTEQLENRLP